MFFVCQRVRFGQHRIHLVAEQLVIANPRIVQGIAGNGQIQFALQQLLQGLVGGFHDDAQPYVWIQQLKLAHQPRQPVIARITFGADADFAGFPLVEFPDPRFRGFDFFQYLVRELQNLLPRRGQQQLFVDPQKQLGAQLEFRFLQLPAQGGLRQMQALSGLCQAAFLNNGPDQAQMAYLHEISIIFRIRT